MVTARFPSATNVFIPAATGQVVAFVRQPGQYKLLEYAQLVKSASEDENGKPVVAFATLDPDAPVRVVTDDEYAWEDGDDPPEGAGILANFVWTTVRIMRRAYAYRLGEQIVNAASFKVLDFYRDIAVNLAMTNKTARVQTLLQTSSNWGSSAIDANTLNGGRGKWPQASADPNSANYLAIRKSIEAAMQRVNLMTNSVVQPKDLRLVISPDLALDMGLSAEMIDYMKGSIFAEQVQSGLERFDNSMWGMPSHYAGVKIIVEDASRVNSRPNAAGTTAVPGTDRNYVWTGTSAALISRKGGLDGKYGSPSFSTVQVFYYKYLLAVEERFDSWTKRHDGRVVDQFKEVLAASRAGVLITNTK